MHDMTSAEKTKSFWKKDFLYNDYTKNNQKQLTN